MPKQTVRESLLRKIDHSIALWEPYSDHPRILRFLAAMDVWRREIESTRYVARTKYRGDPLPGRPGSKAYEMLDMPEFRHRVAFRMTRDELDRLVEVFGRHEVFQTTGPKPQAHPRYQLGVLVFRLAHGHTADNIAREFGCCRGTVHDWTTRSLKALCSGLKEHIKWPSQAERHQIQDRILQMTGIPFCVGYLDGIHINLDRAPAIGPASGSYHSRKERYGFNIAAVCDDLKRFTYIHWGFSARSSDMRIQRDMGLQKRPERFFGPDEYILADSGFKCTSNVVPLFKRNAGERRLDWRREAFNTQAASARVTVEHAFGVLKGRWQALRNAPLRVGNERDEARAYLFIQAAFILHNFTISTYLDFLTREEVLALAGHEGRERYHDIESQKDYSNLRDDFVRRERLVDQCIEFRPVRE